MADHTEEELRTFISTFKDTLLLYSSDLSKINPSSIEDTNDELVKISKVIFAHTTKVGIAFRPPVSVNASYEQLREVFEVFHKLVSLHAQIRKEDLSILYKTAIKVTVSDLVNGYVALLEELSSLDFEKKEDVEGRLVSVGKIWETCQILEKMVQGGELQLLKQKLTVSVSLIDDVLEEIEEWLEDPEIMSDDPFGLENVESGDDEDEEEKQVVDPTVLEFADTWKEKVKLLKLLLSSLVKSLPNGNVTNHSDIDTFNMEQSKILEEIDDLTSNIFMNNQSLYQLNAHLKDIQKKTEDLIKLVKELNKGDEKKTKWLQLWQERFLQSKAE